MARRLVGEIRSDHVALSAAGVAFYGFLALIPGLAATLSVYGLISDPQEAANRIQNLMGTLPDQARELLSEQVSSIAESSSGTLGLTLVVSVALSLWAASSGVAHLNEAINITYDEENSRGFVARRGLALALTLAGVVAAVVGLAVVTAGRSWLSDLLPSSLSWISALVAFAILAVLFLAALSVLFRFAPMRDDPKWRWVTPGALVALAAWLAGSVGFGFYVNNFGSYNETYGSLAAVVVLLLWLFLSAFVVLLASELNAELEHQTARDTTVGPEEPMGARGATVADTVAGTGEGNPDDGGRSSRRTRSTTSEQT